jgi:hypothetical protein
VKWGWSGANQLEGGQKNERMLRGEEDGSYLHILTYEDSLMKPTKH